MYRICSEGADFPYIIEIALLRFNYIYTKVIFVSMIVFFHIFNFNMFICSYPQCFILNVFIFPPTVKTEVERGDRTVDRLPGWWMCRFVLMKQTMLAYEEALKQKEARRQRFLELMRARLEQENNTPPAPAQPDHTSDNVTYSTSASGATSELPTKDEEKPVAEPLRKNQRKPAVVFHGGSEMTSSSDIEFGFTGDDKDQPVRQTHKQSRTSSVKSCSDASTSSSGLEFGLTSTGVQVSAVEACSERNTAVEFCVSTKPIKPLHGITFGYSPSEESEVQISPMSKPPATEEDEDVSGVCEDIFEESDTKGELFSLLLTLMPSLMLF